jgi:hypothetical protein
MGDYQSPRRPELHAIRVRICESEIQSFLQKFPQLSREEIFEEMSKTGPDRAKVVAAIQARANRPMQRAPHPSGSVLRRPKKNF